VRTFIAIAIYIVFEHFNINVDGWTIPLIVWGAVAVAQDIGELFKK